MSDAVTVVELAAVAFIVAIETGKPLPEAIEAAFGALLPALPELALDAATALKNILISAASIPAPSGFENVTSTDEARAKVEAELAASGAAGPTT